MVLGDLLPYWYVLYLEPLGKLEEWTDPDIAPDPQGPSEWALEGFLHAHFWDCVSL